ncbi:MAG: hypothetical protein LBG72_09300 [Spirochaetaceae bacterium]|jgi:hypothetical protein|nr:hypothetical protein [Spirochaetaceae bacterium]
MMEIILKRLDLEAVSMTRVEFSKENYDKLFPKGIVKTPLGFVKLGGHQFEKLKEKKREYLLGAMYQTLAYPVVIIAERTVESDAYLYIKSFKSENKLEFVVSVVVDIEGTAVSISTGIRRKAQIYAKIKTAGSPLYITRGSDSQTHGTGENSPLPGTILSSDISKKVKPPNGAASKETS